VSRASAPAAVRWTAYVAVAVVFAIACGFLANWQFTRNADRSEQLALVAENHDADPVPLDDLIPVGADLDPGDEWRPVVLEGEYLPGDTLLVRNRPHGGTAAFEVLVPLRLGDGRTIIVNRGWVRPGIDQPEPDVVPAPPEGEVTVVVRLRPGEPLPVSGRTAPEGQVPTLNLPLVAELVSADDVVTSAYGAMAIEEPAPPSRPEAVAPPSEDPGPHLSYAIQWILFAIMGFTFIGYVIVTERRHRREDLEDADGGGAASRPARPSRDRDADEEDALLERSGS
jgi:cytochrome oxidase assembly protein ShyY1